MDNLKFKVIKCILVINLYQYLSSMSGSGRRISHNVNFVEKLIKLLEDPNCQQYISWIQTQDGFNISNVTGFTENVLPAYYKHQNFSSFVRQLNMYGFTKLRSKDGQNIYQNTNLRRGSKASIKKIQRRLPSPTPEPSRELVAYTQKQISTLSQVQKIKERQNVLEKRCIDLISKNQSLLIQNQQIVKAIRFEEKKRQKLVTQILELLNSLKPENVAKDGRMAIQNGEEREKLKVEQQMLLHHDEPRKSLGFLDPKQDFLNLDDFLNIDYDEASEGFRL